MTQEAFPLPPVEWSPASLSAALRDAWLSRRTVHVQLDGCLIPFVVGHVSSVAVTGVWATVDGWHVPIERVREVRDADPVDVGSYAHLMHELRKQVGEGAS